VTYARTGDAARCRRAGSACRTGGSRWVGSTRSTGAGGAGTGRLDTGSVGPSLIPLAVV